MDTEGPWPKPGTLVPAGVQLSWRGKDGREVWGDLTDSRIRADGMATIRPRLIVVPGEPVGRRGNGEGYCRPQRDIRIEFWPGGAPGW